MSEHTYDIIIAGGGTAGLVLASRLASASPALSILVLESGPPTQDDPLHTQPARYLHHLRPDSTTVHFHTARPSAALRGRAPVVPCGRCVGGGSSVNFAVYTRAAASDYDDWERVHGNRGWGSADLLPLLRKCETYEIAADKPTHGYAGPLKVSYGGLFTEVGREFLDVARVYDTTRGETDDVNGLFGCNKYGVRAARWIDSKTGKRSDIPHHYIYNRELPNLHILSGHHVRRVLFTNGRASGVEYVPNPRFHPSSSSAAQSPKPLLVAHARRLVVLSAGALGTPAILERSGIGARDVLAGVGIPKPVVDLPGVGENYQDHQVVFAYYKAAEDAHTLDGIARGDGAEINKWSEDWHRDGSGLLAQNGQDTGIKLRPNARDLAVIGESFRKRWLSYYAPAPDKPVLWFGVVALFLGDRTKLAQPADDLKAYAVGWFLTHPASTGRVHITSAEDVDAPLDLHPGFLDRHGPPQVGYKLSREYARRMPSYRGEVLGTGIHPSFAPSSPLVARARDGPVPVNEPEFVYGEEDERALEEWVRANVSTAWHSLGTCAMKARERGGVVDERLNVYGVEGLKVADLSICPGNVGANTYSTAIVIGEKAAVIVAEDLGITLQEGAAEEKIRAHL
ncbi:alcohol oxidase-like protein [Cerioporus squamosus]|nr:alcohol oxidase-like protein [Cerioporus squamosus]